MLPKRKEFERDEILSLMSATPTLAGLCITIVAMINTFHHPNHIATLSDHVFAFSGLGFLLCTGMIFTGLRLASIQRYKTFILAVDILFISSLSLMTFGAFLLVYTLV
ncbi:MULTISPECIES: hypothetical protein [unclassified Moraxella]|uniref:hypothetical protein n=1 Tax=unclassified Moraxella TaxID=2685852 RepID=UPI003AF65A76